MPPRAPRRTPGPIDIVGSLTEHGAGRNYCCQVEHGDRGWAVYNAGPEPRPLRYLLGRKADRTADRVLLFVLLNPSTATEQDNDPTITRCVGYATSWGYGTLWIANAFAHRDTKPANMVRAFKAGADVVGELNDPMIRAAAALADRVVCGWGNHGALGGRGARVRELVELAGAQPHVLKLNAGTGMPVHPLYQRGDLTPQPWLREVAPPPEPTPTEGAPA